MIHYAGMHKNILSLFICSVSIFFLSYCGTDPTAKDAAYAFINEKSENVTLNDTYTDRHDTGYEYYMLDTAGGVKLEYSLDVGPYMKDVYFIFTNTSLDSEAPYPAVRLNGRAESMPAVSEPARAPGPYQINLNANSARSKNEVSEFNRNPFSSLSRLNPVSMLLNIVPSPQPRSDTVDDTDVFYDYDATKKMFVPIRATCRNTATDGRMKISIWVADDCWFETGSKSRLVTQEMADAVAEKFLKNGPDNDIYDWVTNIFGLPWGEHSFPELIPEEKYDNRISILLTDIDNDDTRGRVLGYFWAKDNFTRKYFPYSNERAMFYLDAVLLATGNDPPTWHVLDDMPSHIISTLAHEFQHMIHFYQKTVLRSGGIGSETWIDEMCSLAVEDLIADKLQVNGPRGIFYQEHSTGPPDNREGRLPLYNYFNGYSVTRWYKGDLSPVSYSVNFALGAYLARNFGGASFFRDVVQNGFTDYTAIEYALARHGSQDSFGTILRKWAIANLLSNKSDLMLNGGYKYNNSSAGFSSAVGSLTYRLGSINLYNYRYEREGAPHAGPYVYASMPRGPMEPSSNIYLKAASCIMGQQSWSVTMERDVRMTVVVKDPQ